VAAGNVSFSQPVETVEAYDFVEVISRVDKPDARTRFSTRRSPDHSRRRMEVIERPSRFLRFGGRERVSYPVYARIFRRLRLVGNLPAGGAETTHTGAFKASRGHRKGPVRVDPKYPWHFIWEGRASITSSTARRRFG